jgi:hypothetical protein
VSVLRRAQFQGGFRRLGSKASSKYFDLASESDGDPGFEEGHSSSSSQFVVLPVALTSPSLTDGGYALGSTIVFSAPVLAVGLDLTVFDSSVCLDIDVGGQVPISVVIVASASVRPIGGGEPPLPSTSEASFVLLDLGAV